MVRSRAYAWYVLGLLTAINLFNYIDRMVIVGMYDDLRARFDLTDGQIGALTTAFFTVHAIMTIPFGWVADRWDRRKIIAFGVILWSLATLGSAYALGFLSLLFLRGLIGVGEAAYGPVSNALLCETFRPDEKARTVAIFNGGMFAGACVGIAVGGLLGFPLAFKIVAIPGLVLGVMALFLDVPARRTDGVASGRSNRPTAMFRDAVRTLHVRTLRWMVIGGILISFAAGGFITWFADFIMATKGMTRETATMVLGGIALTGGPIGVIVGGLVADRLQRRIGYGRTLTIAIGFFLSVPFAFGSLYIDGGAAFFVSAWLLMFFIPWYNGPMAAVIDDVVDDADASTAQASFSFVLHLLGTGPAAFIVGWASESWGIRSALILPAIATGLAGIFCLIACRHVEADMRAREVRKRMVAEPIPPPASAAGGPP
jgi:MFS transporter, Spinster family, sphingosine-1-phosphate transporter